MAAPAVNSSDTFGTLLWKPLLALAAAAFAVEIPFFFLGTPSGHDFEFHLYNWLEVLGQWKRGIGYPRWAGLAHFGYGEPRFVFYPPASWTLGAVLSAIFPWVVVSEIYLWLVLVAAGASMFVLARRWMNRRDAIFAAVLYAVNPYHLVIVYWRSAFAELLGAVLLPLLLLVLLRADEKRRTILLALVLAGAWLVNAPAAVMIHYSTALLIVVIAWRRKSGRVVLMGAMAVLLGAALAAFYLFPAIYEQRWINIAQAVSEGSRPLDNFIFVHTEDKDHDVFNRVVSWMALGEIILTMVAAWAARAWRKRNPELWYGLVAWGAACAVLMTPASGVLWTILPKMKFMQFPWRWSLCLGMPFTLLIALGVRRWPARAVMYGAMLCVLGFGWYQYQAPWWDERDDLREMQDNMAMGAGYEGTEEYTPTGADVLQVDKTAPRVTVEGAAQAAIRVSEWGAERKDFTVEMPTAGELVLHLFNYPSWRVEVNGRKVQAETREGTGQMVVPVEAGANRVQMIFVRTWDRTVGAWVSMVAIVFVLVSFRRSARYRGVIV